MSEGWHDYAATSAKKVAELQREINQLRADVRALELNLAAKDKMLRRALSRADPVPEQD